MIAPPTLAVAQGRFWATWLGFDGSHYNLYANSGSSSWGTADRVVQTTPVKQDVASVGSSAHVWASWVESDTIYSIARDSTAWGSAVQVNDLAEASQEYVALGAGITGTLYAVWSDNRAAGTGLYTARSSDNGQTWGTNVFVSGTQDAGRSSLAVTGTTQLHVTWRTEGYSGTRPMERVYYNRSTDGGLTWGTAQLIAEHLASAAKAPSSLLLSYTAPDVALYGNQVYLAGIGERTF